MRPRQLLLAALTACIALAGVELGFRRHVETRFIPETTFERVVAAGDGCVVTVGDSRMVAGAQPALIEDELARLGTPSCVAELAIGAGTIEVQHVAVRRYLDRRRPKLFALGISPESLLIDEEPADPGGFVGNQAIVLGWSEVGDVTLLYPGFPGSHFDAGFRFLVNRSTALGTYGSLVWAKVGAAQDRLVGVDTEPRNQFGRLSEMRDLAETLRKAALERLPRFPSRSPLHPAFLRMLDLFERAGVAFSIVEVPMPSSHRNTLRRFAETEQVRDAVGALARDAGGSFVRTLDVADFDDGLFPDGLHLGPEGARRFSSSLAGTVSRTLLVERSP